MKNKKVFFITRMYSGLFECFKQNNWNPTGIPTITKLADRIAQEYPLNWVVVCKTKKESEVVRNAFAKFSFNNLNISIIPYRNFISVGRFNNVINDILTFRYVSRFAPDERCIFYCDRSNIIIAALLRVINKASVVIRILGLYPDQKLLATKLGSKIRSPFTYLAYRVRYNFAICTQDGSGIEFYLDRLLNDATKRKVLLNGVSRYKISNSRITNNNISLLFVGKLIEDKGVMELIDAIQSLKEKQHNFILNIVGKGPLEEKLKESIVKKKLDNYIKLIGSVKQEDIHRHYDNADIYISLNKLGNLSNTVLEAMAMNKCVVMLQKDENTYTDIFTEQFIPEYIVIRIDRKNIVADLTEKLEDLIGNPDKIKAYSKSIARFAKDFLWSWDDRVEYEINLLNQVEK